MTLDFNPKYTSISTRAKSLESHFDPVRNDYVFRLFRRGFPDNPLFLTFAYSILGFGGAIFLAYLQGTALPQENEFVELFEDYTNIINLGIVLPIAIWLAHNLYTSVGVGFPQVVNDGIVLFEDTASRTHFLAELDKRVNRKWFPLVAFGIAVAFNISFVLNKDNAWNDIYGGAAVSFP